MPTKQPLSIPQTLPDLPLPPSVTTPWSAEVVQAHRGLFTAYKTSRAALNLDESDPIRLGHHLHHARTYMVSIVEVLGLQEADPLPSTYIKGITQAISALVTGLQTALAESTATFVFGLTYALVNNT
jgi:hypothetical protein